MTEVAAPVRCPISGKHSYDSEDHALRALHKVRKARAGRGSRERAFYQCRCGQFHLTSMRQNRTGGS